MKLFYLPTLLIILLLHSRSSAQLSGNYTIPSTIPSIAVAINSLNTLGVSGPVTINIAAGYSETAVQGGYQLSNVAGSSASSPISFVKSGSGPNPVINAYVGTSLPFSAAPDGVWWLIGADYITIDGIDILDTNTVSIAQMEFGYGFFKASPTDGCQHNTIKNCNISLKNLNSSSVSLALSGGSTGILLSSLGIGTTIATSSPAGSNSYNQLYSNLIRNCHVGIAAMGFGDLSPYYNSDYGNDFGGISSATSNTIINFGGGTGSNTQGIHTYFQYSINVSNNVIINNDGSGINPATDLYAIYIDWSPNANAVVRSNTITLSGSSPFQLNGIRREAGLTNDSNAVIVDDNVFPSYSNTCTSLNNSSSFLIIAYGSTGKTSIQRNLISNVTVNAPSASCLLYMILSGSASDSSAINSNSFTAISCQGNYEIACISSGGAGIRSISNNYISTVIMQNNLSGGGFVGIGTGGYADCYITGNIIQNIQCSTFTGINVQVSVSGSKVVRNNQVGNVGLSTNTTNGSVSTGILFYNNDGTMAAQGNTIYSIAYTGTNPAVANTLKGISFDSGTATGLVSGNRIFGLTNQFGPVVGLDLLGTYGYTVSNNLIGNLEAPNTNSVCAVIGMRVAIADCKFLFNTVYLNASVNTATLFSSTCLSVCPSNTTWQIRNNILVNTSAATGTEVTSVIRQSQNNYPSFSPLSNKNLVYAGIPAANHALYYGINTYSTLAVYRGLNYPSVDSSFTENPPFISTSGFAANYLDLNPSIPTQAESGADPIPSTPTDCNGNLRSTTKPDIGAWEGNFTLADNAPPTIGSMGFTSDDCGLTGRTLTVSISDSSGVAAGSLAPRIYCSVNNGTYSSTQGTLTSGTYSAGVWLFQLTYSASVNSSVLYFLAIQDAAYLNNLEIFPSNTNAFGLDVNTMLTFPASSIYFDVKAAPIVSVNSGFICNGETFTLSPAGASAYTVTGGSFTVSPAVDSSYIVVGTGTNGCIASATAQVQVFANPTITANSGNLCMGSSFTITPFGADTYTYSGGSAIVSPTVSTSYSVVGTSSVGCSSSDTAFVTITLINTPTVSLQGPGNLVCPGTSQTLIASGALTYTWTQGAIGDSLVAVISSTDETYMVIGTDANGCTDLAQLTVSVFPMPVITVQGNTSVCKGDSSLLQASGSTISYTWSSGTIGSSVTVYPISTSMYTVGGLEPNGCINSASVLVVVYPLPILVITLSDSAICAGDSVILSASGATNYSWSTSATSSSISVAPAATSSYTLKGTDSNGCLNSDTAVVIVNACPSNKPPNIQGLFNSYPNPTSGTLFVDVNQGETTIFTYNDKGLLIFKQTLENGSYSFDLSSLSDGIYLIKATSTSKQSSQKIVKKNP